MQFMTLSFVRIFGAQDQENS